MALFGIVSGSGFTGAAQFISGSTYEGISLGTLTSGSKYDLSFDYISSAPLNVYSGDYSDKFIVTQYPSSAIAINTGSIKSWSGEFLAVYDKENFLGLGSDGWFAVDKLRVKPIPNLVSNGTFDSLGSWTVGGTGTVAVSGGQITLTSNGGACFIRLNPFVPTLGKKYRFSLQIISRTGAFDTETKIYGYSSGTVLSSHLAVGVNIIDIPYTTDLGGVQFRLGTGLAAGVGDTLVVDNIHVYEIPEWTATGNHTQNLSILDKSGATGQSMLISASGAGRGNELITNGTFTDATGWIIEAGTPTWSISGGVLNGNGVAGSRAAYTALSGIVAGDIVEVTLTVSSYTSGYFNAKQGAGAAVYQVNRAGTHTFRLTAGTTVPSTLFFDGVGFDGTVDNVSAKKYLGEVSLPSANIESVVSGKKYTLEGFARLDASSLGYANTYTSDFSSTEDGFSTISARDVLTPNIDGIEGEDDVLKCVSNASPGFHTISKILGSNLLSTKVYKINLKYYIPTGMQGTNIYGYLNGNSIGTIVIVKGSWQYYTVYYRPTSATADFRFYVDGVTLASQELYIKNVIIDEATPITLTAQLGTKSVTSSALSIVAGTFTKFVLNFEATASEQSQDLKLYLSGAGSVFVDKLSLTQAYDMAIAIKKKTNGTQAATQYLLATGAGGGGAGYNISTDTANRNTFQIADSVTNATYARTLGNTPFTFVSLLGIINRTDIINILRDGGNSSLFPSTSAIGKVINYKSLTISTFNGAADGIVGQISHIQIIRFENIALSTFNSAITGLQYPTGGGAEEVLRQDWSTVIGSTAYDQSPKANNLTGYGVINAATNVITTKEYVIQPDKLIQATDANRPLYVSDSYWEFDGTNDFLYPTGSLGLIKEYYIKFKPDALDATKSLANFNVTSSLFMSSSNSMFMTGSTFATMSLYSSSLVTVPNVISSDWNILHASDATGVEANQFKLGFATTYWDGAIQRFVAYDRQLSDNDKNRLLRSLSF